LQPEKNSLWIVEQHDDKKHSVPIGNILIFAIYDKNMANNKNKVSLSLDSLPESRLAKIFFFNFECQFFNKYFFPMATATEASVMGRKREEKSCYF
jgi:hypothetical protein